MRLVGPVAQDQHEALIDLGQEASRASNHLPLMVHIGDGRAADLRQGAEATRYLLNSFDPGDILTHLATPHSGGVMTDESRT